MPKLDSGQVLSTVTFYENETNASTMRETMTRRWSEGYSLLDEPDLPEWMSRGGDTAVANSPFIGWITNAIIADVLSYPTFATVVPIPANGKKATTDEQGQADRIEQGCNLLLQSWNVGKVLERGMRWHELNSPYCVPIQHCKRGSDGKLRIEVELPASETCFVPIDRAPARPAVLARRWKQLVKDVEKTYADRKGSKPGHAPHYSKDSKRWTWEPVGEDHDVDSVTTGAIKSTTGVEECDMLYLDDGEYVYHMALNGGGESGEIMWCDEVRTGGVGAVVVPGYVTEIRGADRWWPMLYPIYQMIHLINRIRAKRETRSDQQKPDLVVLQDAEQAKAERMLQPSGATDGEDAATELALEEGAPSLITKAGHAAVPWEAQSDEDLDKLEQQYWQELQMYSEAIRETTSSEEMAQATANAYLSWSENKKKQQAPMLDHTAFAFKTLLEGALEAVKSFDEDLELFAESDIEYGKGKRIDAGTAVVISPKDLQDFRFIVKVETRSMTETEIRMRVQDWAERNKLGLSTKREGITAAGYPDEQAQIQALAEERGQDMATPHIEQEVLLVIQERIRLSSRIIVNLVPPPAPAAPPSNPNQFMPMQPLQIPSPVGTSGMAEAPI